jgi:hypothetical protein
VFGFTHSQVRIRFSAGRNFGLYRITARVRPTDDEAHKCGTDWFSTACYIVCSTSSLDRKALQRLIPVQVSAIISCKCRLRKRPRQKSCKTGEVPGSSESLLVSAHWEKSKVTLSPMSLNVPQVSISAYDRLRAVFRRLDLSHFVQE